MRYIYSLVFAALTAGSLVPTQAQTISPQLSSWYTANSGKYARISETDAEAVAGTTKTTWTRTTGMFTLAQTTPTYAGPTQIDYSASWVYVRTGSLATYNMGPWYNNAAKSQLFINVPKNQGMIVRISRTTTTIPTTKTQINGVNVGGVQQPGAGFLVDGVVIYDPTDGFSYANGAEAGPGTGQWHRDAYVNEGITFDYSMAHQQNTGMYHNHANPIALRYQLGDAVAFNNTTKQYSETLAPAAHSPIIGWMLDGLPIYGPYGYSSALDANSGVRRMKGGFAKRDGTTTGVDNISTTNSTRALPAWMLRNNNNTAAAGPNVSTTYPFGRYIQDWAYLGDLVKAGGGNYTLGTDFDLNEYNVRWCVTPEFPSGTWAYFLNISATGTPQFPYMINRWFYGTPTGGKVNSIAESVTTHFAGGPNRPLAITSAAAASGNVTLTWSAVEGGTYSVDASPNNSTWSTKATGLTVSAANTKSNTHAALTTSGPEYARANRTALATYDTLGIGTPTVAQTASSAVTFPNNAPTLDDVLNINGASEDTAFTLTYETLAAASNEADLDGNAISFRIASLGSGTLTKNGAAVAVGTLLSAGESLVFTPSLNANGNIVPFTFEAWDGALASTPPVNCTLNVAAVNDAPTFTTLPAYTGGSNSGMFLHYTALLAAADEADVDGDSIQFRIETVNTGSVLKNGTTAITPGVSTLAINGDYFYWTPPTNVSGTVQAFTLRAYDGALASATEVQVTVTLVPDFSTWAVAAGLTAANNGPNVDADSDGVANILEFYLGGDPLKSDSATKLPTMTVAGGYLTLTFTVSDEAMDDGAYNLILQTSPNLSTWSRTNVPIGSATASGIIFTVLENGALPDTITAQIPIGTNTAMYARLLVEDD